LECLLAVLLEFMREDLDGA